MPSASPKWNQKLIRRAHAVHPIADLQIEYSLISRGPESLIFPIAPRGLGCTLTAYERCSLAV